MSLEVDGANPEHWTVVEILEESMEPALPNGCVAVIDSTSTGWNPPCIEVVLFGDNLLFRRIATDDDGRRVMVCDRPDGPDEPWPTSARIVGRARWAGRWLD